MAQKNGREWAPSAMLLKQAGASKCPSLPYMCATHTSGSTSCQPSTIFEDSPRDSVYLCRFRPPDPPPNKVSNMLQTRGTNFAKPPLSNIHLSLRASPYSRRQEVTVYGASLPSPTPECAG
ncbi:hypothetical protein CPB85DRAFT_709831 [Mucidula mucida]|nr:hypothetical protein CPB85DRAFT_709831 [Mucidula mucida]